MWSSPPTTGSRPPPCASFTLTAVDSNRGVLFGGRTEHGRMNDVYIINVQTMVCLCVVDTFKCTLHNYDVIVVVMIHVCCKLVRMKCVSSILFQHTGDAGW